MIFVFFLLGTISTIALIHKPGDSNLALIGHILITVFSYLVLYLFILQFRKEVLEVARKILFILLAIMAFLAATKFVSGLESGNMIMLMPYAMIPVVIRTFYDARLALFIHLITLMLAALMVPDPFTLVFMNFFAGMIAIFTLKNTYRKSRLLFTSLMVFVSYSVLYYSLSFVGAIDGALDINNYRIFAINGLLMLLSYPVILLFEREFLFLSDSTLLELSDTGNPLLIKLAEEAPGSFQHSLQVANLAEEAARVLGANVLLVRAGALYHDIGKIANPDYYIENLTEGQSPHESLDPIESSKVIINHVRNGVNLARNFKLPVQIIDFIRTHHGTTVAFYFYRKYTDANPDVRGIEKDFTYPGPKPFTRETAIVMMADAVEAASRSIATYNEESIGEMVERIIYLQEQDGQFSDVPLTFRDMSEIKSVLKKRLSNIYHTRIAYPERT
jgi:hypothetical protein